MEAARESIKLKTQKNTVAPKINTIDPLTSAKPIRLNKNVKDDEQTISLNKTAPNPAPNSAQNDAPKKAESVAQPTTQNDAQNIAQKEPAPNPAPKPEVKEEAKPEAKPSAPNINRDELLRMQQAKLQAQALKRKQEMAKAQAAQAQNAQASAKPQAAPSQAPKPQATTTMPSINFATDAPLEEDEFMNQQLSDDDGRVDTSSDVLAKNPNLQSLAVDVEQMDFAITKRVRAYLKKLISIGGSDLHLKAGGRIRARINGDIVIFSEEVFTKDNAITFAKELTRTRFPEFALNKEMDMTYIYDKTTRFRVNIFFQMDGVSFAFRRIPTTQNTIAELGLPDAIQSIVDMERGLVLVTGITGSGKSTTLAAIINEINNKHAKHIITIEDPIEFIHKDAKSIINQRSVGMDTNSFANALKSALREDPDVILVGEMRDLETMEMALHAAETGHLVLSTLHTLDAKETINRVVSIFPTNDQHRIRTTLASTLNAIISQRLLKARSGGRMAAVELLFRTPRIELIISEGRDGEIAEALAEGRGIYHTQTFDQHLFDLIVNGAVDEEIAMAMATSPSDLKLRLQNINFQEQGGDVSDTISIKR